MPNQILFYWLMLVLSIVILPFGGCSPSNCSCAQQDHPFFDQALPSYFSSEKDRRNYQEYWALYDEPLLHAQGIEAYRLTVQFSLPNYVKIYRLERQEMSYQLFTQSYGDGFLKDSLLQKNQQTITFEEWETITHAIEANCFWTTVHSDTARYFDPSIYLLEGFQPNGNHCTLNNFHTVSIDRFEDHPIRTICETIINLDPLNISQ